jgi:hypothetical protein
MLRSDGKHKDDEFNCLTEQVKALQDELNTTKMQSDAELEALQTVADEHDTKARHAAADAEYHKRTMQNYLIAAVINYQWILEV